MPINYGLNNVTTSGDINASGFIKNGGTSTEFLKADGSIDSTTYAPLSSPALTGTPTAPTAPSGTNTNQIATTSFVRTEVSNLVGSAPNTLDTLNELATALGNDPNFATTVTNSLSSKVSATGTANYIPKFSGSQSIINSLIYDNGINVGIGTSAPSGKLDVAGTAYIRGTGLNGPGSIFFKANSGIADNTLNIGSTAGGDLVLNGGGANIQLSSQGGYLNLLGFTTQLHIGHAYNAGNTTQTIRFLPAAKEMMRMTTSGTLGIGLPTSATSYAGNTVELFSSQPYANTRVHIAGSGSSSASAALIVTDSGINPLLYVRNDGSVGIRTASPTAQLDVVGSGKISSLDIANSVIAGSSALTVNGGITTQGSFVRTSVFSIYGDNNTRIYKPDINNLAYSVSNSGYQHSFGYDITSNHNSWMIINNTGLGIGTTTPSGKLDVAGDAYIRNSANTSANLYFKSQNASSETACRVRTDINGNLYLDANNASVKVGNQSSDVALTAGNGPITLGNAAAQTLANQNIRFSPANTERMRITPSGIGINTSSPNTTLHVVGSGLFASAAGLATNALLDVYSTVSGAMVFNVEGTNGSLFSVVDSMSGSLMSVNNNAGLPVFEVFSDDRIVGGRFNQNDWVVTSGGNVGVGTSNPLSKFHVIGTSGIRVGNSSTNGYIIGPSGNTHIQFNAAGGNRIDINSNTYTGSSTYLATQYTYLNNAAIYCNGTFQFPMANNDATSTATQRDSNSIIIYNKLWNGSAQVGPGNEIVSKASTTVNLQSRFAFLMHNQDGTQNRTERLSIVSNGRVGVNNTNPSYTFDVVGSGNFTGTITASGVITGSELISSQSSGDEGGQINLMKPATNTSINTSVAIDLYQNRLRIFESGGSNRGYYLDITEGAAGAGTALKTKSLAYFTPLDNQPPATNFATLDTRNSIAVLDFSDTTEESAVFVGVVPDNASLGSGIMVRINWMATTATTGDCRWGVQFEKMNSDTDSDSFDTATEAQSTTNATAGIPTVTSITCTSIDSLAAGDFFRLKIYRDASDTVNDTMTDDAELISVELRSIL